MTVEEILKGIKENSNHNHFLMVKEFVYKAFEVGSLKGFSKWDVKVINCYYPELTNHKDLSKEVFTQIQDKLEFCRDSE